MDVFTTRCTCSGITLIVMILMLCLKQTFRIQASIKFLYSGLLNILYLYLVQNWICQKAIPTERLFRSYNFIKLTDILTSENTAHAMLAIYFKRVLTNPHYAHAIKNIKFKERTHSPDS